MPSILDTGNELAAKVATDGKQTTGEVSLTAQGGEKVTWWAKVLAKVTAVRGAKPTGSVEAQGGIRWLVAQKDDAAYWRRVRTVAQFLGSDGCTGSPTQLFRDCCYEHDIAYETGRTVEGAPVTKAEADAMFRRCIQERSVFRVWSPLSWWRWLAVRWIGRGAFADPPPRQDWPEA